MLNSLEGAGVLAAPGGDLRATYSSIPRIRVPRWYGWSDTSRWPIVSCRVQGLVVANMPTCQASLLPGHCGMTGARLRRLPLHLVLTCGGLGSHESSSLGGTHVVGRGNRALTLVLVVVGHLSMVDLVLAGEASLARYARRW